MKKAVSNQFKKLFEEILSQDILNEKKLEPTAVKGDDADMASNEISTRMENYLIGRNADYLNKVRKSLQKIEDGTFGECEGCGEEISYNRLLARPTADICIKCKEAEEKEARSIRK